MNDDAMETCTPGEVAMQQDTRYFGTCSPSGWPARGYHSQRHDADVHCFWLLCLLGQARSVRIRMPSAATNG